MLTRRPSPADNHRQTLDKRAPRPSPAADGAWTGGAGEAPRHMTTHLAIAAIGTLAFVMADGLWLGLLMTSFYRQQMAPIGRLTPDGFEPNWPAALMVYVLLGAGLAVFVVPRAMDLGSAVSYGAIFGLVVYGVYDFTNLATLRHWSLLLTLVDVAWGTAATAACAALVWSLTR